MTVSLRIGFTSNQSSESSSQIIWSSNIEFLSAGMRCTASTLGAIPLRKMRHLPLSRKKFSVADCFSIVCTQEAHRYVSTQTFESSGSATNLGPQGCCFAPPEELPWKPKFL